MRAYPFCCLLSEKLFRSHWVSVLQNLCLATHFEAHWNCCMGSWSEILFLAKMCWTTSDLSDSVFTMPVRWPKRSWRSPSVKWKLTLIGMLLNKVFSPETLCWFSFLSLVQYCKPSLQVLMWLPSYSPREDDLVMQDTPVLFAWFQNSQALSDLEINLSHLSGFHKSGIVWLISNHCALFISDVPT